MTKVYIGHYPCELFLGSMAFKFNIRLSTTPDQSKKILKLVNQINDILQYDMLVMERKSERVPGPLYLTVDGKPAEVTLHRMDGSHPFMELLIQKECTYKVDQILKIFNEIEQILTEPTQ